MTLKVGDVVYLNSGGPLMTIYEIGEDPKVDKVHAMWFSTSQSEKPSRCWFISSSLKISLQD